MNAGAEQPMVELLDLRRVMPPPVPSQPHPKPSFVLGWRKRMLGVIRFIRESATTPLCTVKATLGGTEDADETERNNEAFLGALDAEIETLEVISKGRLTTPRALEADDRARLITEFAEAAMRLLEARRSVREVVRFGMGRSYAPNFSCRAREETPSEFLTPPTPRSTLKLVGRLGAVGAFNGRVFVDFDTDNGTWRMPASPALVNALACSHNEPAPTALMVRPATGEMLWAESPETPAPTELERQQYIQRRWRGALDRLAG